MNNTKRMVEGALFVAIYGVFFLVSQLTGGVLESMAFFVLPLPLAIFSFRYGLKKSFVPYIAVAVIGFLINPLSTLFYVLSANILGIVYGAMLKKGCKETTLIYMCCFISMFVNTLTLQVFAKLLNYDFLEEIRIIFDMIFKNGYSENLVSICVPVFLFIIGLVEGYMIHFVNTFVLKRLNEIQRSATPYIFINLPKIFGVIHIVVSILYFIFLREVNILSRPLEIYEIIVFNIFWILSFLMFIQGIAYLTLFCLKNNLRILFLIIFFTGIIFLNIKFVILLSLLGDVVVLGVLHKKILYNVKVTKR